ncbi:unnamed protein product [Didymodactylos carnosus]|uniref:Uncharacterized protein n=1 Tax=Didymodactylos carnosus TaxID=1234261 RepID=A0A8S2U800_9BILA|nr:unnamed protein product [Didymodactylos carnosus]CAF4320580.1 unnamed protein product [Didymodactylos carnosus]
MESMGFVGSSGKTNYAPNCHSTLQNVATFMVPNNAPDVLDDIFHNKKDSKTCVLDQQFVTVLEAAGESCRNADSWTTRHRFTAARRHALQYGVGKKIQRKSEPMQRY